ncbi:TetR/AcrR family transcriptional regulator [Rhodobacteraceae bacterium RKSG542]|uniref:TetR/AcrR family transcriptional regulator n=1 Tax=Pseudovibrio flavus TaxID=2529854 RepID=UPI0012BD58CD|nr:TetR/AcrR family transcriptional regulator [Pseudovibrio flavus]MTI16362.1 TetR/AcrR family transcriptional regulator [Pseudovibrio flavus]
MAANLPSSSAQQGRPRKKELDAKILKAMLHALAANGYEAANLQEIARATGTSKQALYRRWQDKHHLAVEAVRRGFLEIPPVYPGDAPLAEAVIETLALLRDALSDGPLGPAFHALYASPALAEDARAIEGEQRTRLRQLFVVANATADMETKIDQLLGPIYFTCLMRQQPMSLEALNRLVRQTL